MDPISLIYAISSLVGALALLISAIQGLRAKDKGDGGVGEGPTATPPGGGTVKVQEPALDRLLDRLSG